MEQNSTQSGQMDFFEPVDADLIPVEEQVYEPDMQPELTSFDQSIDAGEPQEPIQEQQPVDPQDPQGKRFAYWQSEAAKAQNQAKLLEQQISLMSPYMPVVRYIQENPNILETIEQSLGQKPQQDAGPQRPQPPQKPAEYNAVEAYNDPESTSFKYREANEQYREELANYLLNMEQKRQEEYTRAQEERQFIEQRNQQLRQVATSLTTQYGLSNDDALEFIRLYDDPKSVTLDRLVQLYRFEKGQAQPQANPKVQQMLNRQAKVAPLPAGIRGGENTPPVSDEDIFNASIRKAGVQSGSVLWRNKR